MSRGRPLATALMIGVFVAACGGSSTAAPGSSSGEPAATAGPEGTPSGGGPGGSGDITAGGAFSDAANALDNLDSYKFDVEISSSSTSTFGSEGTTSFTGTVVNKPTKGQQLDSVDKDDQGNVTSEFHFLIIGDQAWTKDTAAGQYTEVPSALASGMLAGLVAFQPQKLFGTAFGTLGSDYHLAGTEQKNGVNAQHYTGDESIGTFFSALAGVSGTWQSDVWLAADGGYLVASKVAVEGATATSAGNFSIDVEITNINDPGNALQAPS